MHNRIIVTIIFTTYFFKIFKRDWGKIMFVYILLFIAEVIFASLFIKEGYPEATKKGFSFKMCAATVFVLNGIYAYHQGVKGAYAVSIIIALIFGFFGDLFLALNPFFKNKDSKLLTFFVLLGGAFFLLEHVTYIVTFAKELEEENAFNAIIFVGVLLAVLIIGIVLTVFLKLKLGKFTFPIIIYALAISSMLAISVCLAINASGNIKLQAILISAPILFVVSDSTLVLKIFDKKRFDNMPVRIINLATYFLAQMLFGLSMLYI